MPENSRYYLLEQSFPGGIYGTATYLHAVEQETSCAAQRVHQAHMQQPRKNARAGNLVLLSETNRTANLGPAFSYGACGLEMVRRLPQAWARRFETKAISQEKDKAQPATGAATGGNNQAGLQHGGHERLHLELPVAITVAAEKLRCSAQRRVGSSHSAKVWPAFPSAQAQANKFRPELHPKKAAIDRLKAQFDASEHSGKKLLFLDECDLHLQPILGNNWQAGGTQNRVSAAGQNYKSYCFGAIDFSDAEVTYRIADRKRSAEFVDFLEVLRQKYMMKLHLVLDNYSIHSSKQVNSYLELHPGAFEFHYLPTYSPWLNPVETVWRQMKAAVCRNYFHGCMANLKRAVYSYFAGHLVQKGALHAAA